MSRIIYVNGAYQPYNQALLHVEDRATLFADAVYEVIEIKNGNRIDEQAHLARLKRSMDELKLVPDFSLTVLPFLISEIVRRNRVKNGFLYIQISRGIAPRDFVFPDPNQTPASIIISARHKNTTHTKTKAAIGIKTITMPDIRWRRPDIKTTSLIASVLARQAAKEANCEEAIFYNESGEITEGAASNIWIITKEGDLITHPSDHQILKGITRQGVMRACEQLNLTYSERPFTIDEAKQAKEAFLSAATNLVMPITHIDQVAINDGTPGQTSLKLRAIFHEFAQLTA